MNIHITNAEVLLFEDGQFITAHKDLYICGSKIAGVGQEPEDFAADKVIDGTDKLVMPGLINAHTHAYMSLFKNFADDRAFAEWLDKVQQVEDFMTVEDIYWGSMLAAIEMIMSGTTCFVDQTLKSAKPGVTSGPESAAAGAASDIGMRAVISRGLAGVADSEESLMKFGQAVSEMETFKGNELITFMVGPHAPYSCMADYLHKLTAYAKEHGIGNNIHLSESDFEMEAIEKEHGCSPIAYVDREGVFDVPTIAAHCVKVNEDDIRILKEKGVNVALNPKSNMKLGNGFAPVEEMMEAGINLCLGTDGSGSNNSLNLFAEMNVEALIHKGNKQKAECVSAQDVLRFATVGGARAIGMAGMLGEIREGALADLIILNLNEPQFVPRNNIVSGLVYSSTGREVETVIINGRLVMENRRILTFDTAKVYEECEKISERLGMKQ